MKLYKVKHSEHFEGEAIYFNPSNKAHGGKYLFLDKIKFNATHTDGWVDSVFYNRSVLDWRKGTSFMDARIIRWLLAYKADNISTAATIAHLKTTLTLIDKDSNQ